MDAGWRPQQAIERTVTVLVIAISTATPAKAGILVKDRLALERMRTVDVVLFDKTGTLTKGQPAVAGVIAADGEPAATDRVLALAAAAEADSEHPLARAIVAAAQSRGKIPTATGFQSLTGRGVQADVNGTPVLIGGPTILDGPDPHLPEPIRATTEQCRRDGATVIYVLVNGSVIGALALADEIRPESAAAINRLHALGVRVAMITGDAHSVADAVGRQVGVDEVFAEVLPADKDSKVAELQARGQRVAMVGDGVNDAPALARADVGIAIGAGTDVAIESAGVVLASDDPRSVIGVITLSRASYRKMWQNLVWATGYNLLAVPLAAGALASIGFVLAPAVGAILMSVSTIIVAANAQLLRRVQLRPDAGWDPTAP